MGRGNATFGQMRTLDVKIKDASDAPEKGANVDLNMDEGMEVKAFSNANFQYSMGARNKLRQRQSKPRPPQQPKQPVQAAQMNPGKQRIMTPPEKPQGGRKPQTKGLGTAVAVPLVVGAIGGDLANRVQDRRAIKREQKKLLKNEPVKKTKGFLIDLLEG